MSKTLEFYRYKYCMRCTHQSLDMPASLGGIRVRMCTNPKIRTKRHADSVDITDKVMFQCRSNRLYTAVFK